MAYAHNYAVAGLQEPGKMNVLSLERQAIIGNTFRFDETGNAYKVLWCDEPLPTEFDAARLAIDGRITLRVAPISRAKARTRQSVATLPIDEWNSETSVVYEVVGVRQDDLPCYECGQYTDTLIIKTGKYTSRDVCQCCAIMLGISAVG
jgi:hypothetical protein